MSTQAQPVRIFIAYSTQDRVFEEQIRKRLKPLLRAGKVTVWDNWDIEAGVKFDEVIREKLHQADLILLLISPDALYSDYFHEVEAPIALRRHKAGEAIMVGVLLRPCSFKHTPFEFEQYELLPKKGYPITDSRWANADEAYLTVMEEVDALVEKVGRLKSESSVESVAGIEVVPPLLGDPNDPFAGQMLPIKGGIFDMGDTSGDGDTSETPVHRVTVNDFLLSKYPVTQGQWRSVMGNNPSYFKGDNNLPVEQVSWDDTQKFLENLNRLTDKAYRLPSEAEWEYAAREGGKKYRFGNGKDIADSKEMNFNAHKDHQLSYSIVGEYRGKTTPVNRFKPNALGIYDMSGNVWEWVEDEWHGDYKNAPVDGSAWISHATQWGHRVYRGGSWYDGPRDCRATMRDSPGASGDEYNVGFRLAHSLPYN